MLSCISNSDVRVCASVIQYVHWLCMPSFYSGEISTLVDTTYNHFVHIYNTHIALWRWIFSCKMCTSFYPSQLCSRTIFFFRLYSPLSTSLYPLILVSSHSCTKKHVVFRYLLGGWCFYFWYTINMLDETYTCFKMHLKSTLHRFLECPPPSSYFENKFLFRNI